MPPKIHQKLNVERKANKIVGDTSRVITRLHLPDKKNRITKIIQRIMSLSETEANNLMAQIMLDFSSRHKNIERIFERHLNEVITYIPQNTRLSKVQRNLIGAYFTKEYSIESAALFNPSIVPHPDQSHLDEGSLRFVMSLRATGEGHISSIVFRSGVLDRHNTFLFDPISNFVETPEIHSDPFYKRYIFQLKIDEMETSNEITAYILNQMPEDFTYNELIDQIGKLHENPRFSKTDQERTFEVMRWLADSNYEVSFRAGHRISERVIFPVSENESRGIEDARFVQFFDDDEDVIYYATYTA
ncbi:MAG: glycosidase, partial [Candidatus Hinthialibacter sp.]